MKNVKQYIMIAAASILSSCYSHSYQVSGVAEGIADGDTLFFTTDLTEGVPMDTIVVKDGKFSYEGDADSIQLAMIYAANMHQANVQYFTEPGTITIKLSAMPGTSRVGGTPCNNEWQLLNDSVVVFGKEINRIAEHIYANNVDEDEQKTGMKKIDEINARFAQMLIRTAERNIQNEFGYFILTYYPDDYITPDTQERLIEQLPEQFRQRKQIKDLQAAIDLAKQSMEGSTISDFKQQAPDGSVMSLMEEIKKNRITIVDFWASWCGPCRHEMPFMVTMYNNLKDKGLGIVGISLDENASAWQSGIQQLSLPWPQMSDLQGWNNAAARALSINSIPHTIVVNQKGKILRRGLRGDELRQFVEQQLK